MFAISYQTRRADPICSNLSFQSFHRQIAWCGESLTDLVTFHSDMTLHVFWLICLSGGDMFGPNIPEALQASKQKYPQQIIPTNPRLETTAP